MSFHFMMEEGQKRGQMPSPLLEESFA